MYSTAQFKLEGHVRVTSVCFVAPLEYFSKLCVSVDNCTIIWRAIHTCDVALHSRVCTCMHACYNARMLTLAILIATSNSVLCASAQDDNANMHVHDTYVHGLKMARPIHDRLRVLTLFPRGYSISSIRKGS